MKQGKLTTLLVVAGGSLVACEGETSMLDPRGPGAAGIEGLWWVVFWIATAVFLVVLAFLGVALWRARRDVEVKPHVRWGEPFIVIAGVVLPAIILVTVFLLSLRDIQDLTRTSRATTFEIEVIGHDWWWEVRYPNGGVTANEMHIPTGEPVRLKLRSADVIHSFWVPRLQAKTDQVSGRVTSSWIQADEPGRYRGLCAEFCGLQHANMQFYVVAEPQARFDRWMDELAQPSTISADVEEGRDVFLETTCVGCHAIAGTPADATAGPDLTHLADRETLFAGTVSNTTRNLETVITDPQAIKPGVAMPPTELSSEELDALVAYLEQLE